ncbi:MAG: hypothetical protein A2756_04915 [Candidatus Ryanbacteria bacterium RIFCSPHIGHO2_01_FULL_48_27]|uniref:Right handed beta helix domain-containing protein n=1 Tax=Candidatus Ryanbacteria bacterium RIFCSPHIGHO2_01_FULL_48_27 TaxID=1802115 RepID=A0A1G2FZY3_9BACT|nr:MAG: hypothetical protein A2756_04915 [Candidatus Ryanbacteria bacterium RIFCSPHIGHO2_01_FULL_48_27]
MQQARRYRSFYIGIAAGAMFFSLAFAVSAKQCGGAVACACGDTVAGTYEMSTDLSGCYATGLVVGSNATLDCKGHRITSGGAANDNYGLYLRSTRSATVKNCIVEGFGDGVVLRQARANTLLNVESRNNIRYGVNEIQNSSQNRFERNFFFKNGQIGVRIASGSGEADLYIQNKIYSNKLEGVYLLEARGGTFEKNSIESVTSAGLYVQDSHHWLFSENTFKTSPVVVTGSSNKNMFAQNIFTNARLKFLPYLKDKPVRVPFNNVVRGGEMRNPGDCVEADKAPKNSIESNVVQVCNKPFVVTFPDEETSAPSGLDVRSYLTRVASSTVDAINGFFGYIAVQTRGIGPRIRGSVAYVRALPGRAFARLTTELSSVRTIPDRALTKTKSALGYLGGLPGRAYRAVSSALSYAVRAPSEAASSARSRLGEGISWVGKKIAQGYHALLGVPAKLYVELAYAVRYLAQVPLYLWGATKAGIAALAAVQAYPIPSWLWWLRLGVLAAACASFGRFGFIFTNWVRAYRSA